MIPKRSIHSKKENEKGERERVTSLVSFERERERERERDVYSSCNAFQFLLEETNLFSFFLPNCLSGMDKFSFLSHKILTKYHSLLNATI